MSSFISYSILRVILIRKIYCTDAVAAIIGTVQPEAEQLDAVKPKAEKPDVATTDAVAPGPEVSEHTLEVTVVDPNAVDDNTEDDDTMEGVKLEIKVSVLPVG